MVDIFSRSDGPRKEDVAARRMIDANRQTIARIADRLTEGGWSASQRAKAAPPAPTPERSHSHSFVAPPPPDVPAPYVRISANNRVVVADARSGRQMHFLGEVRRRDGNRRFTLATQGNGFISPVAPEIASLIGDLDGRTVPTTADEKALAAELTARLGLE